MKFISRLERSIPDEWVITAIITAIGSLAFNAEVFVNESYKEPLFFYTMVVGGPATRKSQASKMIKEELLSIRKKKEDAITLNNSMHFLYIHISIFNIQIK
jgi:hypothetical protein